LSSPDAHGPRQARLFIGGAWQDGDRSVEVHDKFTGTLLGHAHCATRAQVEAAVTGVARSFEATRLDPHERWRVLSRTASLIEAQQGLLADTIVCEAGLPITDAANEARRAVETFRIAAEEAKRLVGEMVPIEGAAGQSHRIAFTIRAPRGVVCGITSFNSPLNMVAHKVAPALASGNTVLIKPPQPTPFSAVRLVELLLEAGLPPGHVALVQGPGAALGPWLIEQPQIRFFTFTGSTKVGKWLRQSVGMRPIVMELGSIAATIVCDDANLDRAAIRCASSGFRRAGQACTSTQRLFVQTSVFDTFTDRLLAEVQRMPVGDPRDPLTAVGPMISEAEAIRAEHWVREAIGAGARCLTGGSRVGALFPPTVLTNVRPDLRVVCEEIFAPVLTLIPFESLEEAITGVNHTSYGLAAGIFTQNIGRALAAARQLAVGVVHINDASSSRVDLMPFGGVKDSGVGREGPRYAMREMTEERVITISAG
jgi:succinate-semialdehyde dehydrogenase/glutarate-semialdehyde dehydrogenase